MVTLVHILIVIAYQIYNLVLMGVRVQWEIKTIVT